MPSFCRTLLFIGFISVFSFPSNAQRLFSERSSLYGYIGSSGAELREFNKLLSDRGLSPLRNRYRSYGLGYQSRINDFILGFELSQNQSKTSTLDDFEISYRASRAMVNVGYALTEEGKFQLIHYMSLGVGSLNFQMLPNEKVQNLEDFLTNPEQGFVLRENDIQKGTQFFGDFLTEIGFQLSYDFDLPGRSESLLILAKMGYSFSPLEGKWNLNGMLFNNAQSGAFFRVGAGLTLPDRNFTYKDASIGINLMRGVHFTKPTALNSELAKFGLEPFSGAPSNWGLRILGQTNGLLYGVDVFNGSLKGQATNIQNHSLNSVRIYANAGLRFFQYKNLSISTLGGFGFGNIRYSLLNHQKPNFPEVFEQRYFDGYLSTPGLMAKPEIQIEYGIPMTSRKIFDLVLSASGGYELALGNYRLGELSMADYLSASFITFGVGIKPR
ncbi:hypothetical protein AO498_12190 [Algoriphagus sanaruensis]|uniref:Uncharacterized protein n=1 Tax=Algoriphagus sanaruensis TaxID=1727163 RepID=A0A142EPZ3_9BACT|nr:hypothetical protein AO498_12190 [Algoriphagus sanaruensis]